MGQAHGVSQSSPTAPYYISFTVNKKRISFSSGVHDRRQAIAISKARKAAEIQAVKDEKLKKDKGGRARDITVAEAISRFLHDKVTLGKGEPYREVDLVRLLTVLGPDRLLSTIDDEVLADVVDQRSQDYRRGNPELGTVSRGSVVQSVIRPLSAIMNWARKVWKMPLPDMPYWKIFQDEGNGRERELSFEEEVRLWPELRDYADVLEWILLTGLRRESALIRWSNVHWVERRIKVKVKGGKLMEIRFTPEIERILRNNLPPKGVKAEFVFNHAARSAEGRLRRIQPHGLYDGLKAAARRAGIEDLTVHDFRRTAGARMYRATGNILAVSKFLGHASVLITIKHYVHVTPDDILDCQLVMETSRARDLAEARRLVHLH